MIENKMPRTLYPTYDLFPHFNLFHCNWSVLGQVSSFLFSSEADLTSQDLRCVVIHRNTTPKGADPFAAMRPHCLSLVLALLVTNPLLLESLTPLPSVVNSLTLSLPSQ